MKTIFTLRTLVVSALLLTSSTFAFSQTQSQKQSQANQVQIQSQDKNGQAQAQGSNENRAKMNKSIATIKAQESRSGRGTVNGQNGSATVQLNKNGQAVDPKKKN